jgi:hypothetical protein
MGDIMKHTLNFGSVPSKESHTRIQTLADYWRAWNECDALIDQLCCKVNWRVGCHPYVAFGIHSSTPHMTVICIFPSKSKRLVKHARRMRAATPEYWDAQSRAFLTGNEAVLPADMEHARNRIATWPQGLATNAKLPLGRVVTTDLALFEMLRAGQDPMLLLQRHASGDWGSVDDQYRLRNDAALIRGEYIISSYMLNNDVEIWILTEDDRSLTIFILPKEYDPEIDL